MKNWLFTALPWGLLALAAIFWAANWPRLKRAGARLASGLALGPVLGILLNGLHLWQGNWPGLILGLAWGPLITVLVCKNKP